jgi:glycosyltransferase involved in cell wall biosynthesis
VNNHPLFSVVICTYNRAQLLENCFQSLADQTLDKKLYEVIVVNNNSTDSTQRIAELFCEKEPNFRVVQEINQGLSYARNRGWQEAEGDYVAYIDDDAKASPDWLKVAYEILHSVTPAPLCLGGPIYPFYLTKKPVWFKDAYEVRSMGPDSRWLSPWESFCGSNMILKKEVFTTFGGFPTDRGVRGDQLSFGEETFLFNKIRGQSKDSYFYYGANLVVYHLVPRFKMTLSYPIKRAFVYGYETGRDNRPGTFFKIIKSLLKLTFNLVFAFLKGVSRLPRYERFQYWFIEEGRNWSVKAGYIAAILGLKLTFKQR